MKNDCRNAKLHFQMTFSLPSTSCLLKSLMKHGKIINQVDYLDLPKWPSFFSEILAVRRYLVVERHEWDFNPYLCDASAVLCQSSYQGNWDLVAMWVDNKPVYDAYSCFKKGCRNAKVHATIPKVKVTWDMINSFNRREANFLLYLQTYTYGVS